MVNVKIQGQMYLTGLTLKECEQIEQDLTFRNPKYEQIMKYSKWGSTREPQFLTYYRYLRGQGQQTTMQVPVGYRLPESLRVNTIEDNRCTCVQDDFPRFLMTLRPTQQEALDKYIECNELFNTVGSVQMPTGKGKTILGLAVAEHYRCSTLIIVHKTDLVNGWQKDIKDAFGGKADVGLIKAQTKRIGKHFTIATIQTLNRLSKDVLEILYKSFGLVIQDEMHHCPSSSFSLADNFESRYRLGLTATPERNDGLAHVMNLYYGDFCFKYGHRKDDEDILPVKVVRREVPTYFNPVITFNRGIFLMPENLSVEENYKRDYALKEKQVRITDIPYSERPSLSYALIESAIMDNLTTMDFVCRDIFTEYSQGHSCIAFFTRVEAVEKYAEYLITVLGVPESDIGLYYGNNKDCDKVLEQAEKQRNFITLATYSKATEGTNVKQWEVGFLVSSINTGKNVEQAVGRIRRTKNVCKLSTAILYDYRYNSCYMLARHGATRDERYIQLKFDSRTSFVNKGLFTKGFKTRS